MNEEQRLNGTYDFYRGKDKVAKISFNRGSFDAIKRVYDKKLLPPYIWGTEETPSTLFALRQFFQSRQPSPKNPYYGVAKCRELARSYTLFDPYSVAIPGVPPVRADYVLETDCFAGEVFGCVSSSQKGEEKREISSHGSPNLTLPFPFLSLFGKEGDRRYLLLEYSKELADIHKQLHVPYELVIVREIPFLRVYLDRGEYFPLKAVVSPTLKDKALYDRLSALDGTFDPEHFHMDYCFLRRDEALHICHL